VNDNISPSKLLPRSFAGELALAIAPFAGSAALVWHAIVEARQGKSHFTVMDTVGFALVIFGGCFDPVNFAALFLPWVWNEVAEPTPFRKMALFFYGAGLFMVVVTWISRHFGT
jgi:hypothetical protein